MKQDGPVFILAADEVSELVAKKVAAEYGKLARGSYVFVVEYSQDKEKFAVVKIKPAE